MISQVWHEMRTGWFWAREQNLFPWIFSDEEPKNKTERRICEWVALLCVKDGGDKIILNYLAYCEQRISKAIFEELASMVSHVGEEKCRALETVLRTSIPGITCGFS